MSCKLAITSMSLGWAYAGHHLEDKLITAHLYGYKGIELFWDDLRDLALRKFKKTPEDHELTDPKAEPSQEAQLAAAHHIRTLCDELDIFIICLQPFVGYEGHKDPIFKSKLLIKLKFWFQLAKALKTDMIQIPSSYEPAENINHDLDLMADDLREVADLGAKFDPPLRFVYEALSFGTVVDRWETSWEIVKKVDRDNFGLCIDSFNLAGRVYADPTAHENNYKAKDATFAMQISTDLFWYSGKVDINKVFYVQIVDGERLTSPLDQQDWYDPALPPRMNWSRNCRLFYGEQDKGAYLPVRDIAEIIFNKLGYKGWVSLELFNRRMRDEDPDVPNELARRGAISWAKLVRDLKLQSYGPVMPIPDDSKRIATKVDPLEPDVAGEESSVADEASSPGFDTDRTSVSS